MLTNAVTLLRGYFIWARRLPQETELLFAARSPFGRWAKIFFFGVGLILPLGSLIWALLYWHGKGIGRPAFSGTSAKQPCTVGAEFDQP